MPVDPNLLKKAIDPARIEDWIEGFSAVGKDPEGGITRRGLSEEEMAAKQKAISLMKHLGLRVRTDLFGNVIGRRNGRDSLASPIMTGSHLDTVQNGGGFDGAVGVVGALEAIHALNTLDVSTRHPIEVIVFTSEEPNRFGISAFGSKGLSGKLILKELADSKDEGGTPLPSALKLSGIDWESLQGDYQPPRLHAFIEIHVEQGEKLYHMGMPIGVVLGVTGINRRLVIVHGEANHSGTTTMTSRKDALMAASEIMLMAEQCAILGGDESATATVGRIQVKPNQVNIIPGEVILNVEFRSYRPEVLENIEARLDKALEEIRQTRGIEITSRPTLLQPPIRFSEKVIQSIRQAVHDLNFPAAELFSMAGHDANHLASVTDAGMIFVPSRGGFSHCKEEWTDPEDIAKGSMVLVASILRIDGENL